MPRLSRAQEEARQRIARLAASGLPPARLAPALLAAMQVAVPADVYGMGGVDPATLLFNRVLALSPEFTTNALHYLHSVYLSDPVWDLTPPGMMHTGSSAHVIDARLERSWGIPPTVATAVSARAHTESYQAIPGPEGGVLRAAFPVDGRWIAAVELLRFDPVRPFRRGDVAFVRLIAPTIGRALRSALDRERTEARGVAQEEVPAVSGVLVLAANGRVIYHTPAAERWVRVLREVEHGGDRGLPLAIMSVVAGARAGVPAVIRLATPFGPLRIEATPGEGDGTVAVVLTPEQPPAPPAIPDDWPLTPQERTVVALLLRGLGNRQLAERLSISENTVEAHLRHAYEKLGVHSRSQLAARFFRDTHWPGLALPEGADAVE
jgi:DNA-binding CsgD family transcriptional regulator